MIKTIIIPLAGPDYIDISGMPKGLIRFKDDYHLRYILKSRPWYNSRIRLIFVLRDNSINREFASDYLEKWFHNSASIFLGANTRGAAMSVLCGAALCEDMSGLVIVDLADIYYEASYNIEELFLQQNDLGAIAITFKSNSPIYSYLKFDGDNKFLFSKEKQVISNDASAGTYIFKNVKTLISSVSWLLENENQYSYNDLFYICPGLTGVRASGLDVIKLDVKDVVDLK